MNLAKRMIAWFLDPAKTPLVTPARKRVARYSGEELRAIRARNGVGRPPAVTRYRWGQMGAYDHLEEMMRW